MNHFKHPGCNLLLGAPQGWADDPTNIPCNALPVEITYIQGKKSTPCVVSYWKPTPAELQKLQNGGHVALSILGQNMPPVMLYVDPEETQMQMLPLIDTKELKQLPIAMFLPHERQAILNHGQSLHRLAERGGLSAAEALGILESRGWGQIKPADTDEEKLLSLFNAWSAK